MSQKSSLFSGAVLHKIRPRAKNVTSTQGHKAPLAQLAATIAYQTANAPLLGTGVNQDLDSSKGEINEIISTAPNNARRVNILSVSANSTQTESPISTQSPYSLFETTGSRSSREEPPASLSDKVAKMSLGSSAELDLRTPILTKLREEPVQNLTCRIKNLHHRAFFEGTYSNVWKATLEGIRGIEEKLVRWFLSSHTSAYCR